ncbi:hypothetical protein SCOCK_410041 [Actinacidiphila cocklensis]|uniref:Uncharacterized protein n=1 Tax=Actinacidiphila cocklensis TaxID=887465 RepID=A0A9W4DVY7_9ACTN|nr:hypothetical protein SCOCK_410041 [Actinacidiphila cocklensis]
MREERKAETEVRRERRRFAVNLRLLLQTQHSPVARRTDRSWSGSSGAGSTPVRRSPFLRR